MSYISHIGTAVPTHKVNQKQACEFFINACELKGNDARKARIIYKATKIKQRFSVIPDYSRTEDFEFYPNNKTLNPFPTTAQRMKLYEQHALDLGKSAVENAFPSGFGYSEITHLITFSCTGMYAPGLDIDLINSLGLPKNTQRVCINFMGCYAAFSAMKTAQAFCLANPKAKVLAVGVELCTIHFQKFNTDDQLLSNAIFGDGASAFLMQSETPEATSLKCHEFFCDLIPNGAAEMAWHIADFGFEMRLSSYVPQLLSENIQAILSHPLKRLELELSDIEQFAIHPGGKRIVAQLEKSLGIESPLSYEVLEEFGNMSSVTVLFVLKKILANQSKKGKILSMAFGPGLTLEGGLLELV